MFMKISKFLLFPVLFCASAVASGKYLSVTPVTGKVFQPGASSSRKVPVISPEYSLTLHKDHFEISIKTPKMRGNKPESSGISDDHVSIFGKDVAEFLISTDPEQKIYYHFAIDPAGHCYTAKKRDRSWNPAIRTSTGINKDSWEAIFQIPYKEIGTTRPDKNTVWRANFASKVPAGRGMDSVSWSGAYSFHNISEMGIIDFRGNQHPVLLNWNAENDIFSAKLFIPPHLAKSRAECEIDGMKYPGDRSGDLHLWQIPLQENYVYHKIHKKVRIALYSPEGKLLFERTSAIESAVSENLVLEYFYCSNKVGKVSYTHTFKQPAVLLIKDHSGKTLGSSPAPSSGSFPVKDLVPGRYVIELKTAERRTSRVLQIVPENFAPPAISDNAALEIKNDKLYLDGHPVFLLAHSGHRKNFPEINPVFNMNIRQWTRGRQDNAVELRMTGIYFFNRKPFLSAHLRKDADKIFKDAVTQKLPSKRIITRLAYEAQIPVTVGSTSSPRRIDTAKYYADLYKKAKLLAPDRLFSIQSDAIERWDDFYGSCDIFEAASYKSSYAVDMMPELENNMRYIRRKAGRKPVIFWLGGSIPNGTCRTAEELRAGVYYAIMLGLNGSIFHIGHSGIDISRTRIWSLISGINAEIQTIYREFASGREVKNFVTDIKGNFLYSARLCGDKICMIVINKNGSEQKLQMKTLSGDLDMTLTPFEPFYSVWKKPLNFTE